MKKAAALVLALVMCLSLVACGTSAPAGSSAEGMATGMYPGTMDPESVTVNISSDPPDMNSITTTDSTAISVLNHINEGLTSLDGHSQPVPGVAESWTTSEDGLVWTFTLRQDAAWSNGTPITANDFVFAMTRHFSPETGAQYAGTWATYIKGAEALLNGTGSVEDLGVKALDDHTVEYTLNTPCAYFLNLVAFPSFFPVNEEYYMAAGAEEGYGLDADKMLFNGPYIMSEWQHEDHVTLTNNETYWDDANKGFIPTIVMKMITDSGAALNAFEAGEIDMIGLAGEQAEMLRASGANVKQYADGTPAYVQFNTTDSASSPALQNAKVRRAITLAIDADSYNKNVAKNSNLAADGMVPPVVNDGTYNELRGSLIERPTDDWTEVKALFEEGCAEAGVDPASMSLRYVCDEGDGAYKMAAFIQNQLQEHLGLVMTVESMPFKSRLQAQANLDFDMCLALWGPDYNDAMTYLDMFTSESGNNHTGWANADYDALIEAALMEGDLAKHQELLVQAETLLMEEMPIAPVYFRVRDYITSDKLVDEVRNAFQETNMVYAKLAA